MFPKLMRFILPEGQPVDRLPAHKYAANAAPVAKPAAPVARAWYGGDQPRTRLTW
jgi:hypothetical protein